MLEFSDLVPHFGALAGETARRAAVRAQQIATARRLTALPSDEWAALHARIVAERPKWLTGRPALPHAWSECCAPPPDAPARYTALSCDGSQIPLDRHEIAACYVLNVGRVALHYGTGEPPLLDAKAQLFYHDADIYLPGARGGSEAFDPGASPITDRELATRRFLLEMDHLGELIEANAGREAPIAFVDGTLILWTQEAESSERRSAVLARYLAVMERARARGVPVAGYLSRPASREAVGALRVALCPHTPVCAECAEPTGVVDRLTDADLFADLLRPGERSGLFTSDSRVLAGYKPDAQRIAFYYLHTGAEIARVELPLWVAEDAELAERTHAVALDQARKGMGYPVCLSEAHEQAVVRAPERAAFYRLVERSLLDARLPVERTAKAAAKRRPVV